MYIPDEVSEALNDLTSRIPRRMRDASNILKENTDKIRDEIFGPVLEYLKSNVDELTENYEDLDVVFDNLLGIALYKLNENVCQLRLLP